MYPPSASRLAGSACVLTLLLPASAAVAREAQAICLFPLLAVGLTSEVLSWLLWLLFPALGLGAFLAARRGRGWLLARLGGPGLAVLGLLLGAACVALGLQGIGAEPLPGDPSWSRWGVCNFPNEVLNTLAAVLWLPTAALLGAAGGVWRWTPRPLSARLTADPPGLAGVLAAQRAATPPPLPTPGAPPTPVPPAPPVVVASAAALTARLPPRRAAAAVDAATRERIAAATRRLRREHAASGDDPPAS